MKLTRLFALTLAGLASTAAAAPPARPMLVVAISVDQFSADLFAEYRQTYTGGLKRLANAIVFPSGYQSHAATETCPGHATILTGTHPARAGVIANDWMDLSVSRGKDASHVIYCAEDETVSGSTPNDYTVSAVHLKMPTMGDRMKTADPRSRVVAVAGKDRAAVMMGGHATDAIWYLDPKTTRSFVTLPGRDGPVPAVVSAVNARIAGLIDRQPVAALPAQCASRLVPIALGTGGPVVGVLTAHEKMFRTTAAFDAATADIAIGLLKSMKLGRGAAPDILAIGLSATDYVGHAFGTSGAEMCAQMAAVDLTVGRILAALDANGAPYVVVLTADHGGLDAPERHDMRGLTDVQRVDKALEPAELSKGIVAAFNLPIAPKSLWFGGISGDWYLSKDVPDSLRPEIIAATRARLLASPQVDAVLEAADLRRMPMPQFPVDNWSLAQKAKASFDPARSGDLVVLLKPRVMAMAAPRPGYAATHGSPWDYDRRVPMLFWYPGAVPHEEPLSVEAVDILPTLAGFVGLKVPAAEIDGRCLDLDPGPETTCKN